MSTVGFTLKSGKGMYGLKQAGLLANQLLQTRLAPFAYCPARHTPGLLLHKTRPIGFSLIVDDFAVKYVDKQHTDHLRKALLQSYELTTDWECLAMFQMYSASSNKMPPSIRNTYRQNMSHHCMGQKLNIQRKMIHPLSLPNRV
jgi:hypothetical protein